MTNAEWKAVPCDLCGGNDAAEIEVSRLYTGGPPIHVCKQCGLVYVRSRRTSHAIADDWSDKLFGSHFSARVPAIKARLVFAAEVVDTTIGLKDKDVCDIGAGEGVFLDFIRQPPYAARVFGVEPSAPNGKLLDRLAIEHFVGTAEDFGVSALGMKRRFDVVSMLWTLENCGDPKRVLRVAHDLLKDGGHIVLATGSRILVPFKKPLYHYLGPVSKVEMDTHTVRCSANTQAAFLATCGFEVVFTNRYIDHDVLCMVAQKANASVDASRTLSWQKDDYRAVIDFFNRWHKDTQEHFPQRKA